MTDTSTPHTIVIAGASGMIGSALTTALRERGHHVIQLTRQRTGRTQTGQGVDTVTWDPARGFVPQKVIDRADAVINLAGASIGDRRWDKAYKKKILHSRVCATSTLARAIARSDTPPQVLLQASATGFYGFPEHPVDEKSFSGSTFLAAVCRAWEAEAKPAMNAGCRVVFLRTGIVLDPSGGALKKMLIPLKLGVGGPLGSGNQVWSWITLADHVRACLFLLDTAQAWGPVNLVAPGAVTQRELTAAFAQQMRRPALVTVPSFALRVALGQFAGEITRGVTVRPTVLDELGFTFDHPTVDRAARWAIDERGSV